MKIQKVGTREEIPIKGLPANLKMQYFTFSPKESYCAFVQVGSIGLSLWVVDLKTGAAKEVAANGLCGTMGTPYVWGPDDTYLFCKWKGDKGKMMEVRELPKGPATQDATGVKAPARTYQDLLRNKQDEAKFDYYTTASWQRVQIDGTRSQVLKEGVYSGFSYSPDGKYILTQEVKQPYSYTLTYGSFPSQFNIYTIDGQFVKTFYDRPLQDKVPVNFDATEAGKRYIQWRDDMPATLYWCVAPDGGNPEQPAEYRDEVYQAAYPFTDEQLMCKLKNRFAGIDFGTKNMAIVSDSWWKNRNSKTYLIDPSVANSTPKVLFDVSSEDLYNDPGSFVSTYNQWNRPVLMTSKNGKQLYMTGEGYSPEGNKPFIASYDPATQKKKMLWQADGKATYEKVIRITDPEKGTAITSIESSKMYPNYYLRSYSGNGKPVQITFKENPYKSIENVSKTKIYYKRNDGVDLYGTLYLPANYDKNRDGRLPMLMAAYPTEYKDAKAAGQVKESPHEFTSVYWGSPVYWVTRGYAVLDEAQFPIIGKGNEEPNDTYVEQLVADAAAAIKAVDSMQVVDPKKCAVMGHSYGAFMTANLLAHSNLFAAGIARSGAYNRTLTPFSFQAEERTYWQAQQVYNAMSPFNYADKIKTPLLLIHGDADNNPGTFTLQSERMFQAIKGNGGKARLVLLPYESHGYAARENILHMLWEMDTWLEKYVKNRQ